MLDLLCNQFYWSGITKDAEVHIVNCDHYIYFERLLEKTAMENIQTTHSHDLLHLDFLMIEETEVRKDVYMLVMRDHLT